MPGLIRRIPDGMPDKAAGKNDLPTLTVSSAVDEEPTWSLNSLILGSPVMRDGIPDRRHSRAPLSR
jgi:hypothetical protein